MGNSVLEQNHGMADGLVHLIRVPGKFYDIEELPLASHDNFVGPAGPYFSETLKKLKIL